MNTPFGKIVTAMITPFNEDGSVNYAHAVKLAHDLVANGSDTILLAGTTGESPTLTHDEEFHLFEVVTKALKGHAKVMAGAGSNCTRTAIESSRRAQSIGVDGLLHVVPYYNKPSQEGMVAHFSAIANAVDVPIMLYNIPGRCVVNMEPETVAALSKIDNIVAIKEAANSVEQVRQIRLLTDPSFAIYSGDDANTLNFMVEGACGVVSVASHVAGQRIRDMINAFYSGDIVAAKSIHEELMPLFKVLFITTNPSPTKAALRLMGYLPGGVRLPLVDANDSEVAQVKQVLSELKFL